MAMRGGAACRFEHVFDRGAVGIGAVHGEREPQRQATSTSGQLVRVVGGVPLAVVVDHIEVRRVLRVHHTGERRDSGKRARRSRTARTATCADRSPGSSASLDAREPLAHTRREEGGAAVGGIDVHPSCSRFAYARRRRRGRRRAPALVVPAVATTAHRAEPGSGSASRAATSAGPVRRSSTPGTTSGSTSMMRIVLATDECVCSLTANPKRRPPIHRHDAPGALACDHQRRKVGGRAALHEHATSSHGQPGEVAQESKCLVLGMHRARRLDPRDAGDRRARHDHVEQQRRLRGRGRNERQERGLSHEITDGASTSL